MPLCVSHFELAKKLEDASIDFHVGNLLPDICHYSDVVSKESTHFITDEPHYVYGNIAAFVEKNIKHRDLDERSYHFALGHLVHIITDLMWGEVIYLPIFGRYKDEQQRLRRYLAVQFRFVNRLFSRWDKTPGLREEFLSFKKYPFHEVTLTYPFYGISAKKLNRHLEQLIAIQSNIKKSFDFEEEELQAYEKELRRYIPAGIYEEFLDKTVERIDEVFEEHNLQL